MQIRAFEESDRVAVISLWREVFAYTMPHNDPALVIDRKMALQRELFFVAILDEQVAGTVMGGYDGHRGWIYSLAVDPRRRRRGIGATLVRHLEKALADLGCVKINLQVLASNPHVVAFYEKLGYRVEERISMGRVL
jgi:ribosomal protein S18 acetylase RimI-like enzyme